MNTCTFTVFLPPVGSNDWSWRIRYAAIQGLVKICRCCTADSTKEGMRTVAWNSLLRAHSLERDSRVLESLKVGQVHFVAESRPPPVLTS